MSGKIISAEQARELLGTEIGRPNKDMVADSISNTIAKTSGQGKQSVICGFREVMAEGFGYYPIEFLDDIVLHLEHLGYKCEKYSHEDRIGRVVISWND